MFKVVTDQLKVSQGWVRCGQCAEVFDASKHLLPREASTGLPSDIEGPLTTMDGAPAGEALLPKAADFPDDFRQSPTATDADCALEVAEGAESPVTGAWPLPRGDSGKNTPAGAAPVYGIEPWNGAADVDPAGWTEALPKRQWKEAGAASTLPAPGPRQGLTRIASDFVGLAEALPVADDPPWRPDLVRKATMSDAASGDDRDSLQEATVDAVKEKEVSFVRDAVRKDFWNRPSVRGLLAGFSLMVAVLLGLQWVLQQKDSLAASAPQFSSALQLLCRAVGCEIAPPRQVESLVIDSSTFNKIAADTYRLSFVLKNTGDVPLEMPALELTLTDTQDQAVVRRVLFPPQFGVNSGVLAARAEVSGVVSLRVSADEARLPASGPASATVSPLSSENSLRVAGYRVLAFYP